MPRQTPLYNVHKSMGARMIDFGGWDMPVNYGSQIDEHNAVRQRCGMFDVSHMCPLDVFGPDARAFLRRLLANDVARLTVAGKALYSTMLNAEGCVVDDLIVYWLGGDRYRVVVNAGTADKDLAWMEARRVEWGHAVQLVERRTAHEPLAMIAVQGPKARETVYQVLPHLRAPGEGLKAFFGVQVGQYFVATTGYTGEDGFEIALPATEAAVLWQDLAAAGVAPCGLGARDTLRLEAGMNLYGQDMDETVSPLDAGLGWTVDFSTPRAERDFVGRAALESCGQTAQFLGLVLLDPGVLRGHQVVHTAKGTGITTSGTFSPTLQRSIAFARVPLGVAVGEQVEVEIRDKRLRAEVTAPLFARRGRPVQK